MRFHLLMLGTSESDSKYVEFKSQVFRSWLNICFLNVYGVQRTERIAVVKPRSWFLSLSVLHNLGLGKYLNSKSCANIVWQVPFSLGFWSLKSWLTREPWAPGLASPGLWECQSSVLLPSVQPLFTVLWIGKCMRGKLEETGATHSVCFPSL